VNSTKVVVLLPEILLGNGAFDLTAEVCFNGQQFSNSAKTFKYLSFPEGSNEKDRLKIEDDLLKLQKKKK
jgi:hypothetical protein